MCVFHLTLVGHSFHQLPRELQRIDGEYWCHFNLVLNGLSWDVAGFTGNQNKEYVAGMSTYIEKHPVLYAERRAGLSDEVQQLLQTAEALAQAKLQGANGLIALVNEFTFHWELRDHIDACKRRDMEEPKADTLYLEEDYMELQL